MKKITLPALVDIAWDMITTYHKNFEPGTPIDPLNFLELSDEINEPSETSRRYDGLPVYSLRLDRSQTRDGSEREIQYSMIHAEDTHETQYFLHP